jgi:hypothetical protein
MAQPLHAGVAASFHRRMLHLSLDLQNALATAEAT